MDKRILESERKLKDAFVFLMQKNDPSDITVKNLCSTAGLNRSTFYERFGYLDNLIESIIGDCLDEVCAVNNDSIARGNYEKKVSRSDIRIFLNRFLSNSILMNFCKSEAKEKYFYYIIKTQVKISIRSMPHSIGYYPAFFQNAGVLGILLEWISKGKDTSEEQIVEIIHEYSKAMYHKF